MKQFTITYRAPRVLKFSFIDAESDQAAKRKVLDMHSDKSVTILTVRENNPPLATIAAEVSA